MSIDIYRYDDFRAFLKDLFAERKEEKGKYTQRELAADAGFTNPGYFNDVIQGRRTLSANAQEKLIVAFGISAKEAEFFRLLVDFAQEKHPEKKQDLYRQIVYRRGKSTFVRLNPARGRYYQDYRYPLLRAAIEVCDFRGNYHRLAGFLRPPLPVNQVKKLVRDLCDWGLVKQDYQGHYRVTDRFVEPEMTMKQLIRNLNKEWIRQGAEAIDLFDIDERHISSLLMSVSFDTAKQIRQKIEAFRQELFEMIQADENPQCLLQMNLQLFPRSAGQPEDKR